jgi:hypothetical protein
LEPKFFDFLSYAIKRRKIAAKPERLDGEFTPN